jgi:hypothetical protein
MGISTDLSHEWSENTLFERAGITTRFDVHIVFVIDNTGHYPYVTVYKLGDPH